MSLVSEQCNIHLFRDLRTVSTFYFGLVVSMDEDWESSAQAEQGVSLVTEPQVNI